MKRGSWRHVSRNRGRWPLPDCDFLGDLRRTNGRHGVLQVGAVDTGAEKEVGPATARCILDSDEERILSQRERVGSRADPEVVASFPGYAAQVVLRRHNSTGRNRSTDNVAVTA